jgi:hypothetical protein
LIFVAIGLVAVGADVGVVVVAEVVVCRRCVADVGAVCVDVVVCGVSCGVVD